jgi:hypothetical protein
VESPQDVRPDAQGTVATAQATTVVRRCDWCQTVPLTGRQKRFCSDAHKSAWWDHHHPRLGTVPVVPEGRSLDRIVALCADGRWRTAQEIGHDTGTDKGTVIRRIQESQTGRRGRAVGRFKWESRLRRPCGKSRAKEFRLVLNVEER